MQTSPRSTSRARGLAAALALAWLLVGSGARADAIGPCPPGFSPSHSGCHFDARSGDLGVCLACGCTFVVLGLVGAAIALRGGRKSGPREG